MLHMDLLRIQFDPYGFESGLRRRLRLDSDGKLEKWSLWILMRVEEEVDA